MAEVVTEVALETERLAMRRALPGDLETWLEHINTPEVTGFNGGVQSREQVEDSFARMAAAADEGQPTFYCLTLKSDGRLIGKAGLARIETAVAPDEIKNAVQIGWTLRPDCWGQGYAREAAQAFLAQAFEHFGAARVYSQTSPRNAASMGLMVRLGMTRRTDLEYDDPDYPPEDNPTVVYCLERATWPPNG